jgi:hypothetical protein
MVERNVWGSNLRRLAVAATGVMIGLLSQNAQEIPTTPGFGSHYFIRRWLVSDNMLLRKRNKSLFGVTKTEQTDFRLLQQNPRAQHEGFACIPPDKIEWRVAADKFTLDDLARHIATTERTNCVMALHLMLCSFEQTELRHFATLGN